MRPKCFPKFFVLFFFRKIFRKYLKVFAFSLPTSTDRSDRHYNIKFELSKKVKIKSKITGTVMLQLKSMKNVITSLS